MSSGDLEIVINTRTVERCAWALVIIALAVLLWWRWDGTRAATDVATQQQIAALQTQLSEKDDLIAALRANSSHVSAPVVTPPVVAPPVLPAPVVNTTAPTLSGKIAVHWNHTGSYVSTGHYKLESVTITVDNGQNTPVALDYALCWSSIECVNVVTRGTVNAPAGEVNDYPVDLTIPTIVDVTKITQKLRISVLRSGSEIFYEDALIK